MKKHTNNITEIVFILDRSGSMGGLENDTIGGFNAMLKEQKEKDGKAFVTTVLFDHERFTLHDRLPIEKVPEMTAKDYTVRGCTALLDAIGYTIEHIKRIHHYARREDVPASTMFVITTDGYENASRHYSGPAVKKMINAQKKKGWEFLFIGANIDAIATARDYGIESDRAVNYHADAQGTQAVFQSVGNAVSQMRACAPLQANWSEEINADYESRKKH